MPRILVVYYSRTSHTKDVAERLAFALGAELEPIVDRAKRTGLFGWLRSGKEGMQGAIVEIGASTADPARYDMLVIGTPIWSGSISSPVRSYLRRHRAALPRVAFFLTCGGRGIEKTFAQMAEECGHAPVATLALREAELPAPASAIARFVGEIHRALGVVSVAAAAVP